MGSITVRPVLRLFAVAQVIIAVFLHLEAHRPLLDLVVDELVSSVAERLTFGAAAEAPREVLAFRQVHLERLLFIDDAILALILRALKAFDYILRNLLAAERSDECGAIYGWLL